MMYMTIMSFMLMINIIFSMMIHPLAITLMIIIQTMTICLMTGSMSYSFWFSYILFMIFLGGMLVLFIYITSLASNEMFKLPIKMLTFKMFFLIVFIGLTTFFNHFMTNYINKYESINMKIINTSMELNNLNQLYNYPNLNLMVLAIMYLLFTMIAIVNITQIQEGPLRQSS